MKTEIDASGEFFAISLGYKGTLWGRTSTCLFTRYPPPISIAGSTYTMAG